MTKVIAAYRVFNILSLDVVAGSVICALFFGKLLHVTILPYGLIGLGLTVWIVYTADHLLDAKSITQRASSARHRFHQRYFNLLRILLVVVAAIDFAVILYTRKPVLVSGMFLAFLVLVYLFVQRYLKAWKEFFVALFYTCGILLPSVSLTEVVLTTPYFIIFFQFFLIAITNLLLFSWFEQEDDKADYLDSFVTSSGKKITMVFIYAIAALNFLLSLFFVTSEIPRSAIVVIYVMHAALVSILIFNKPLRGYDAYRLIGDAVFLLPLLYIL